MLRNNFGTIRGCERAVDVFFHFDSLDDGNSPGVLQFLYLNTYISLARRKV